MNVKDIIEKYLRDNGYDGLAGEDCGCGLDDLGPCGEPFPAECVPGYRIMCDGNPGVDENGEESHECFGSPHEMFTPEKPNDRAASLAGQPASPASPDIRPAGYNRPLSGPEVITGQPVSREWLRWQAGEIWSAKTIDDAMDTLADTLKGFGVEVEGE